MRLATVLAAILVTTSPAAAERLAIVVHGSGISPARTAAARAEVRNRGFEVFETPSPLQSLPALREAAIQRLRGRIDDARNLFLNNEYVEAINLLEQEEKRLLPLLLDTLGGHATLVRANLWLGSLHIAAGSPGKAERRFQLALALDGKALLDPAKWPPEYTARFEHARDSTPPPGTLAIRLPPGAAEVFVDGKRQPNENRHASIPLPSGDHYLHVHSPGRQRVAKKVHVPRGEIANVHIESAIGSAAEIAYDLSNIPSSWLTDPSPAISQLATAHHAAQVFIVQSDSMWSYDSSGRRNDATIEASRLLRTSAHTSRSPALYERWWFWGGLAAVAGGSALIWVATREEPGPVHGIIVP